MRTGSPIVRVPAPFTRCYAVRGEGLVVVDVGPPRSAERVRRAFAAAGLDPTDTDLIVLTHGHWDHVGAAEVTRELTGAPIAMHVREAERLGRRGTPIPPGVGGWGRILSAMARRLPVPPLAPFEIGLEIRDEVLPLEPFGVGGRVVPTPGHSPGSVSVVPMTPVAGACIGTETNPWASAIGSPRPTS